ncbi:phosphopantothenate synthase [Agaricicola taiwanensis]|uniref:Coenzyme A biosynthesis bifunctional protein CoaBC n=1 Tax=Agaricicola taiwanensis TaxID=591372 RepID=A0A8J2VMY4_9RHOB|nr:bifunctional phosphopantothenoylcysteine decarboxylase/phosphopantothenate--cysteine ligase CoaBC [Agaricicola taiwanensis]GGE29468.1 phosphopantothenate synthase [Agaricicola taiwanensis]
MLNGRRILLIVGGGIAAYKTLDLVRRLKERGASVRAVLTDAAQQFVTPLSMGTVTGEQVFTDLFDLTAEHDVGHIRLARDCDLVVVAPATADLMAKMASGLANDLASTALLATDRPVLMAPAMNPTMWSAAPTRRNKNILTTDGIGWIGPATGAMAERGESGLGRMSEPLEIVAAIEAHFGKGPLSGRHLLVTSGPTHEPIDPVRVIANRSSGRQGHAIAQAAAGAGAKVTLVSGPVALPDPQGVQVVKVETAREMLAAVEAALPADAAVFAAAVADWRVAEEASQKIKKGAAGLPTLSFVENPDILATISRAAGRRPRLVVGFAAETSDVVANAAAKRMAKGCDWILANDVSAAAGVFGGEANTIHMISEAGVETWPRMDKAEAARQLIDRIAKQLGPVAP